MKNGNRSKPNASHSHSKVSHRRRMKASKGVVPLNYSQVLETSITLDTSVNMTYHGGPILGNVKVYTLFWGSVWNNTEPHPGGYFFDFFSYMFNVDNTIQQLEEYAIPPSTIGKGSWVGTKILNDDLSTISTLEDSDIVSILKRELDDPGSGITRPSNVQGNLIYFVYIPPGITSISDSGYESCNSDPKKVCADIIRLFIIPST